MSDQENTKGFWEGKKTTVCNLIGVVLPFIPQLLPAPYSILAEQLIEQNAAWLIAVICGGNIALRQVTKGPPTVF